MYSGNPIKYRISQRVPKTKRYCLSCKKITEFGFVPLVKHSRCVVCGGWYCRRPKNGKRIQETCRKKKSS